MYDFTLIEENYHKFIHNLTYWLSDAIFIVNIDLLYQLDLLHFRPFHNYHSPPMLCCFYIMETVEKITLINEDFIIWIKPDQWNNQPATYILIALNKKNQPLHLELAFICTGIYNNSPLVMKILEKFLLEIQETEKMIANF